MILNNVHDLSFYFPLHRRESIGTFSFSWLYTFCFVFCVIHSTRFQQARNRIHAMNIHLRNQQPKIAMLEWNVFYTSVHLFYLFWSQRNNFNEQLFFVNYPLYNTAIHLLSTNYCWPIQIDIYLWNVNSHFFFFFISFSFYL